MKKILRFLKDLFRSIGEQCPHCGFYCTGKTVFCTKHPDGPAKDTLMPTNEIPYRFRAAHNLQGHLDFPTLICYDCANVYPRTSDECPVCKSARVLIITDLNKTEQKSTSVAFPE